MNEEKNLMNPLIPTRKNPIISTLENPVFEDDARTWISDPNPYNLSVPMDFWDPSTDKYHTLVQMPVVQQLQATPQQKLDFFMRATSQPIFTSDEKETKEITASTQTDKTSITDQKAGGAHTPKGNQNKKDKGVSLDHVSPYRLLQRLLKDSSIRIVVFQSSVYIHKGNYFKKYNFEETITFLMEYFAYAMPFLGKTKILRETLDCLIHYDDIIVRQEEISPALISFDDILFNYQDQSVIRATQDFFTPFHLKACYTNGSPYCPIFENFLHETSGNDPVWEQRLWEVLGYLFTPDNSAKSIFVFQGVRDSGKSLLSALLQNLYSDENIISMDVNHLEKQFGPSNLAGKYLCVSPDLQSSPLDTTTVSWLKRVSGGDKISADVKYKVDMLTFNSSVRFLLCTNHPLRTTAHDPALYRRLVVLPFKYSVPLEQQDRGLLDRILLYERDAIVKKALIYARDLSRKNYRFSGDYKINDISTFENVEYADCNSANMDIAENIRDFVIRNVEYKKDEYVPVATLYKMFASGTNALPIQQFSKIALPIVESLFNAEKAKKRIPNEPNPVNVFMNIKLKEKNT